MTSTKYRVLFWFFSIFLAFSLFVLSIVFVLASPTHNIGSQIGVNYEAPVGVNLNFVNNTGSDVVSDAYEIRYNEDITQFYIEGIVPSSATYQDGSIINDKGQEFYYFSNVPQDDNGNVIGNAGEGTSISQNSLEENVNLNDGVSTLEDSFVNIPENKNILAKRYYPSSSTDPIWYDLPEADIELYSTFLTPNCTDGTDATIGANTDIVISHQVTSIPNDAFRGSSSTPGVVTSVVIPNGITSIGSYAFYYNYALSNVVLPSTLTTINSSAFYYCHGLTNITVPQKVSSIGSWAFYYNHKLIEVNNLSNLNIRKDSSSYGHTGYYAEEVFDSINYDSKLKLSDDGLVMYENTDDSIYHAMGFVGGKGASVILPTTSYDYDIYNRAFYYNDNITSITIPSSVTSIGSSAFYNCTSLETVTFGENSQLVTIGSSAFGGCSSLTNITIPESVTSIGSSAFSRCSSLESVIFGENSQLTSIGVQAFYDCNSLTSITIPGGVTSIGFNAFVDCNNIQELYIDDVTSYLSISYGDSLACPLCETEQNVSLYVNGKLATDIVILNSVTEIPSYAFKNVTNITSVTIPSSVTSIGSSAFNNCTSLETVTFGENSQLTSIKSSAFYNCDGLTSITIPGGVTSIGKDAFYDCISIQELYIDDVTNYLNISYSDSYSKPLYETNQNVSLYVNGELATDIAILDSATEIPSYAFNRVTNITSVTIPSSVTSIGSSAFSRCSSLESVIFGENSQLVTIGSSAFGGCSSLTNITIPESVTSIGSSAFSRCSSLESVIFGENSQLTSIGVQAFYDCNSLTSITIPGGVTSIGFNAFYDCISIQKLYIDDVTSYLSISYGDSLACPLYETDQNVSLYVNGELATDIVILDSVTEIPSYAFKNVTNITSVTIPSSVTSIGSSAFNNCTSLETVTFGENSQLTSIKSSAFYNCDGLTSITIPGGVTSIGKDAFYDCISIQELYIDDVTNYLNISYSNSNSKPLYESVRNVRLYVNGKLATDIVILDSVTEIPSYAFNRVTNITSVTIPSSVTSIGSYAFRYCSSLESINIPEGITAIDSSTFYDCSSLTNITIPESVTSIGSSAFDGCSSLEIVDFGENSQLASIGSYAFRDCSSLTSITIPNGVTSIGSSAFYDCYKLVEVYDLSSTLTITAGSSNNGSVGYYADYIYTSLDTPLKQRNLDNYTFYYNNDIMYLLKYTGNETNVKLPSIDEIKTIYSDFNGDSYRIYEYAFYGNSNITSITIPESVTSIGSSAFENCFKLVEVYNLSSRNITVGSSSNGYVGYYAKDIKTTEASGFYYEGDNDEYLMYEDLEGNNYLVDYRGSGGDITLPKLTGNKTYEINQGAFYGNLSITNIVIPSSITSIGSYAFYNCSILESVDIPNGITAINSYTFSGCKNLHTITIPSSVTSIGGGAFGSCVSIYELHIDSVASYLSISFGSSPSEYSNYYINLYVGNERVTDLIIPNTITSIPRYAFQNFNITSVTIPSSVTSIGYFAFYNCNYIEELYIDDLASYLSISYSTFSEPLRLTSQNVSLYVNGELATDLVIPGGVTTIPSYAFRRVINITSVTIPSSVTSIGSSAFSRCSSLVSVIFGENSQLESIGEDAFNNCTSLQYNEYGNGLYFGNDSNPYLILIDTNSTSFTSFNINSNCKIIAAYAFRSCSSLTSITIPSSVTNINANAFVHCSGLISIIIPSSVTTIDDLSFQGCSNLTIYCEVETKPSGWESNWNYSRPFYWAGQWKMVDGVPVPIESGVESLGLSDIGEDFGIGFDGLGFREEIYFNDKRERKVV